MQTDGNACPLVMEGATVLYFRLMPPRDREPLPDKTKQIQSTLEQAFLPQAGILTKHAEQQV